MGSTKDLLQFVGVIAAGIALQVGFGVARYHLKQPRIVAENEVKRLQWEMAHSHTETNPWDNIPYQVRVFDWEAEKIIRVPIQKHSYQSPMRN